MKSHPRAPHIFTRGMFTAGLALGLGLSAVPGVAFADEPSPPPSGAPAPPPAPPAPAASDAPAPAPAAEPAPAKQAVSRPLPASVLAMQGHEVVLRLDGGAQLQGYLISANEEVFEVQLPDGKKIRIPRGTVRGARLVDAPDPARATRAETAPDGEGSAPEMVFPHKERSVGFGTAFGGGVSGGPGGAGPALLMPTAELQVFLPGELSIDLSVPLLNMALGSALIGGTLAGGDLYFSASVGQGRTRFVAGTGLGFAYVATRYDELLAVKVPAQLGFEVLSKKRTFGFKLVARPWLELANDGYRTNTGGGLLGALVFTGYALSDRTQQ